MVKRILAAVDLAGPSAHVVALAGAIAGPGSRIRFVHAIDRPAGAAAQDRGALLRKHAAAIPGAEHKILEGEPARAILQEADAWRADTIIVAPTVRQGLDRIFGGSVSTEILRRAPTNVLFARSNASKLDRILMCADLHEPSQRAARTARLIAQQASASVSLLYAADPIFWGPDATAPWPQEVYDLNGQWLDRAQQEAIHHWLRAKVDEFNKNFLDGEATPSVREGLPKDVILREAAGHDLVVVGTRTPNAYERVVVGSVAEHVATRAPQSVLVVKK